MDNAKVLRAAVKAGVYLVIILLLQLGEWRPSPESPRGLGGRWGVRGPKTLGPDGRVWPEATASCVRARGRVTVRRRAASGPCLGERAVAASAGPPWEGRQQLGRPAPGSRLGRRRKGSSSFTRACADWIPSFLWSSF